MQNKNRETLRIRRRQAGFTLLEYAAGAAVLLGVVWAGMNAMGTGVNNLLSSVGSWADSQAGQIGGGVNSGNTDNGQP